MAEETTSTTPGAPPSPDGADTAAPGAAEAEAMGSGGGATGSTADGEGRPRSVIDALVDFVETSVAFVRQELGAAVRDKAIVPVQRTAVDVAVLLAMAIVLALGVAFIAVGLLLVIAMLIGWPATMFVVGGILLVGAVIVMLVVVRRMQAREQSL